MATKEWALIAESLFCVALLIIAILPLLVPLLSLARRIVAVKIVGPILLGIFIILSAFRLIIDITSYDVFYFSNFMVLLRRFIVESGLCTASYWHAILGGKISLS